MSNLRSFVGRLFGPLLRLKILSLRPPARRWSRYLLAALAGVIVIWGAAATVLTLSPESFTSRWTLILPGSGSEASLFLQGIGQASSNSASPYASISRSPQVNYREIVGSDTVLALAAELSDMTVAQFGKPRVKLIQQSSLMSFSISGDSAERAQLKARAINEALLLTLERLRSNEMALREAGLQSAMDNYSRRMKNARTALLEHQTATQLITTDQIDELVHSVESLGHSLIEVAAEAEQKASYLEALTKSLNVSKELAAAAVVLHADELVRDLMQKYVEARSVLQSNAGSFGRQHPRMRTARLLMESVIVDLERRAAELIGDNSIDIRRLVLLDVEDSTGALFRELVLTAAQLDGARAKHDALSQQLDGLRERLRQQVGGVARLADLERNHKIAEAVFSSALARADTGKADLFVSYPLIQTLVEPSHPQAPDGRAKLFVLAGALAASLCWFVGLLLLWFRTPPCMPTQNI